MSKKHQCPGPTFGVREWVARQTGEGSTRSENSRRPGERCEAATEPIKVNRPVGSEPALSEPEEARAHPRRRVPCDRVLLGVPVRLVCDHPAMAHTVRAATSGWLSEPDPTAAPLTIVLSSSESAGEGGSLEYSVSDSVLTLSGEGVAGVSNPAERTAGCALSSGWLARPGDFAARVLEPLVLFLATQSGRIPIHASAILVDEVAILFAGRSGSGKSSLALAGHRAGLPVLSEDTVYVRQEPSLAIWGWNGPVHLLPGEACPTTAPLRMRNGRLKHTVTFDNATSGAGPARSAVMCVLAPGADRPGLTRLSSRSALDKLHPLESGFDLLRPQIEAVHSRLCHSGGWLLSLSPSPDEAISVILANLDRLKQS